MKPVVNVHLEIVLNLNDLSSDDIRDKLEPVSVFLNGFNPPKTTMNVNTDPIYHKRVAKDV